MESIIADIFSSVAQIPESEICRFIKVGKETHVSEGDCFIKEGQLPRKFGLVQSGLFRYMYVDSKGKTFTKAFMPDYSIISSYSAMVNNHASYFSIEALENSTVFEIDFVQWEKLRRENVIWDKFLIAMLEKGYSVKERREREFLLFDATERYRIFLKDYPTLEKRIKQHIIASYLGITPIALSRIRKKMDLVNLG